MVVPHEALPTVRLSPSQSCSGCTTITSGYDFRKGHRRISAGFLSVSWHSPPSVPFPSRPGSARVEASTRRPPPVHLDAIAGRALLAMPRRSTHHSGCVCEGGVRGDHLRGGHHLVQTA